MDMFSGDCFLFFVVGIVFSFVLATPFSIEPYLWVKAAGFRVDEPTRGYKRDPPLILLVAMVRTAIIAC